VNALRDWAIENCWKCGKEIFLKDVASYKVLADFRLVCADCALKDGLIASPQPVQKPSAPSKKQPQR